MNAMPVRSSGCGCCESRRRFLAAGCGACAASAVSGLFADFTSAAGERATPAADGDAKRPRVRLVFACFTIKQERPTWPHIGYDFAADIERVTAALRRLCPQVEFLPAVAHGPEDAEKLLAAGEADRIDGYLVYQMNNWVQVMQTIVASGQADARGRFPLRRQRRVPGLHGGAAPHAQELLGRRLLEDRRPGRVGQVLRGC